MSPKVDGYIARQPAAFQAALTLLRHQLATLLPDHIECLSYAMPGFRAPGAKGKMVIGYAAFARHLGLYPHSGGIIAQIDCAPYKTSKSGLLFAPENMPPLALIARIVHARQAELAAGFT